jgi:hypothetical protein
MSDRARKWECGPLVEQLKAIDQVRGESLLRKRGRMLRQDCTLVTTPMDNRSPLC